MEILLVIVVIGAIVGLFAFVVRSLDAARRDRKLGLLARYGEQWIVDNIRNKVIWTGETSQQLLESLGRPTAIDETVMKTKKTVVWKYAHKGGNRFGLRITLEDNVVVGWDQKL